MRKSMAEARRAFTRDEILATAQRLFTERGVQETSIGQVAEAVGMTRANLYYYFPSKDALLQETLVVTLRRYRGNWSGIPAGAGLEELAERVVDARYAEIARQGPLDLRFFYVLLTDQAGQDGAARVQEEIEAVGAVIRDALTRRQAHGEVRADLDVREAGYSLIMEMMGLDMLWLVNPGALDLRAKAADIAHRFVEKVRADP
jgi:AcrR family transcriptional regulator